MTCSAVRALHLSSHRSSAAAEGVEEGRQAICGPLVAGKATPAPLLVAEALGEDALAIRGHVAAGMPGPNYQPDDPVAA